MAIEVEEEEDAGGVVMYSVFIAGELIMGFRCDHAARHASNRLSEARDAGPRRGMQILTTEFGMGEDSASYTLALLSNTASGNLN